VQLGLGFAPASDLAAMADNGQEDYLLSSTIDHAAN